MAASLRPHVSEPIRSVRTLFQRFYGHPPVLGAPQGLPHLSEVALSQLLQEPELLAGPLPRLHVEEFPLQTEQSSAPRRTAQDRVPWLTLTLTLTLEQRITLSLVTSLFPVTIRIYSAFSSDRVLP